MFVDAAVVRFLAISHEKLAQIAERESVELERRARVYRQGRPRPQIEGRTVILVDDGIATGVSARAAIRAVRELGPRKLILDAPVIAADTAAEIWINEMRGALGIEDEERAYLAQRPDSKQDMRGPRLAAAKRVEVA